MASVTRLRDAIRQWRSTTVAELLRAAPALSDHRDPLLRALVADG
jgi:hypothetical protein